jgi:uncharacterized protein (TIGR03032 family)
MSGDATLLAALAQGSGVRTAVPAATTFLDGLDGVDPAARGLDSHALTAADADVLAEPAHAALEAALVDREGRTGTDGVAIAAGARLALRVPFLDAAFPDARFVFVARDPAEALPDMLTAWRDGTSVSVPELPGWEGPWSLPLIGGWRDLRGEPLETVVAEQWRAITEQVLDDLERVPADRWAVTHHAHLLADPRTELRRVCAFLGLRYDQALLTPLELARHLRDERAEAEPDPALAAALPRTAAAAARQRELLAAEEPPAPRRSRHTSPFRSVSTTSFLDLLRRLGSSLLVSTYQTNRLVIARERDGRLNTHFRTFDKPMGIAGGPGRFSLGTRTEVWDFRDLPAAAAKVEPLNTHDACFLPRNRHVTGDIAVHELGFAGGELWVTATGFSCLATLDADHSFVPRWMPPFISAVAPGDRCHLNGMAVVDDRVRYVTALGATDEPGGWRARKADGGVLMDVPSSEVVASGLSMPHSPRWYDDRLWVLESGRGTLAEVDLATGAAQTVVELPGFTRGLLFAGRTAFVGLSQIRESSTFGDLPLTQRLQERLCGVWMVDIDRGEVTGFLRFDDLVQEVFDLALVPARFPEVAEPDGPLVASSYWVP